MFSTNSLVICSFGLAKISNTVPVSTTRPSFITATRSQMSLITCISWVITTMVMPSSLLTFFKRSRIALVVLGSSALVDSSLRIISGSLARALAIATRCFCPPDNCDGYAEAFSSSSTSFSKSRTFLSFCSFVRLLPFNGNDTLS